MNARVPWKWASSRKCWSAPAATSATTKSVSRRNGSTSRVRSRTARSATVSQSGTPVPGRDIRPVEEGQGVGEVVQCRM